MENDLDDVDRMVVSLKDHAEPILSPFALFKFEISVSEALSNVVKHAKTSDLSQPIAIELSETPTALLIEIYDPVGAEMFDIRDHAKPIDSIDPLAESGRGLGLIIQYSDHVDYGAKDGSARLSLEFLKTGD